MWADRAVVGDDKIEGDGGERAEVEGDGEREGLCEDGDAVKRDTYADSIEIRGVDEDSAEWEVMFGEWARDV